MRYYRAVSRKASVRWLMALLPLLAVMLTVLVSRPVKAAGPSIISFQGKVVNADGTNVTNGTYTFDFVMYSDPTLGTPNDGVYDKWRELAKSVTVTNGVFQTNLGSATALPDFNTNNSLYLAVRFNNDAAGYMSPRVQMGSVPYALNADKVGGVAASSIVQLGATQSGNINISSGTITSGAINGQTISSAANFTGSLTVAGGTGTLGSSANVAGSLILFDGSGNTSATLTASGITTSYSLTMPVAAGSTGQCLKTDATVASQLVFGSCGTGGGGSLQDAYNTSAGANPSITLTQTYGGIRIRDGSPAVSGNLFSVQNNGGTVTYFGVTASGISIQDGSATAALAFESGTKTLKVYGAAGSGYASITYSDGTSSAVFAASTGITQVGLGTGGDINLYATNAADKLVASKTGTLAATYTASDFSFTRNLTIGANAANGNIVKIEDTTGIGTGSIAANVLYLNQNNAAATGNLFLAQTAGSVDRFKVTTGGAITAAGSISVGAGQSYTGAGGVSVSSGAGTALTLTGNAASTWSTSTGDITIQAGGANKVIAKAGTDSTSSFEVQNLAGTALFKVDTESVTDPLEVQIGSSTDDANFVTLGLDVENTFTEAATCTSAIHGSLYYNGTSNSVRSCLNGAWEDMPSTAGLSLILYGVVAESGDNPGDIGGLVTANQSGPCKASWLSSTSVRVAPCTAYSGGRKVVAAQTDITAINGVSLTYHICLTGTNNQPATSAGGAENANLPAFSASNPTVCLADVKTGAGGTITQIYDTRVFTTSEKTYATLSTTSAPGMIVVGSGTAHVFATTTTADSAQVRGVVIATDGAASTTTINAIIVTSGTQWVKCTATCAINSNMTTSTTAGYGESGVATTVYPYIGNTRRATDGTTCTNATNCQMSNLVEIRISDT